LKNIRTLKNSEFKEVYSKGKSKANRFLVMIVINTDKETGLGISVSKKVGNSVVRHRVTRLIRESFRLNRQNLLDNKSIVVIARNTIDGKNIKYEDIESAFIHLCKIHNIYS